MDQSERLQRTKEIHTERLKITRELVGGIERVLVYLQGKLATALSTERGLIVERIEMYTSMLVVAKADLEAQEALRNAGGRHGAA